MDQVQKKCSLALVFGAAAGGSGSNCKTIFSRQSWWQEIVALKAAINHMLLPLDNIRLLQWTQ